MLLKDAKIVVQEPRYVEARRVIQKPRYVEALKVIAEAEVKAEVEKPVEDEAIKVENAEAKADEVTEAEAETAEVEVAEPTEPMPDSTFPKDGNVETTEVTNAETE